MAQSAISQLDVARKIKKRTRVVDVEGTIATMEAEQPPMENIEEATIFFAKKGFEVVDMTRGQMLLEAAQMGLVNIIKVVENPQYRIDWTNNFGEGLLHFAAKGNQERMIHYLLLRGLDPNVQNKFKESAIFIAAEMGSLQVVYQLYSDKRTKVDLSDKFGDTIMHFAARDGQFEVLEYILEKTKKLISRKNQEGKTPLKYAMENGHHTCSQLLRNFGGTAECGNRQTMIKDLADKLMNEPADYRKSVISKQTGEKIEKPLISRIEGREDLLKQQVILQAKAIKKRINTIKEDSGDGVAAMQQVERQHDQMERTIRELSETQSPVKTGHAAANF